MEQVTHFHSTEFLLHCRTSHYWKSDKLFLSGLAIQIATNSLISLTAVNFRGIKYRMIKTDWNGAYTSEVIDPVGFENF